MEKDWIKYYCKSGQPLFVYNKETGEHKWLHGSSEGVEGKTMHGRPVEYKEYRTVGMQTDDNGCSNGCMSMYINTDPSPVSNTSDEALPQLQPQEYIKVDADLVEVDVGSGEIVSYSVEHNDRFGVYADGNVVEEMHKKMVETGMNSCDDHERQNDGIRHGIAYRSDRDDYDVASGHNAGHVIDYRSCKGDGDDADLGAHVSDDRNVRQVINNAVDKHDDNDVIAVANNDYYDASTAISRQADNQGKVINGIASSNPEHKQYGKIHTTSNKRADHVTNTTQDCDNNTHELINNGDPNSSGTKNYRTRNTKAKFYQCSDCNMMFKTRYGLVGHSAAHTEEQNYECSYCEKKYAHQAELNQHLTEHAGENLLPCSQCKKNFPNESALSVHMKTHTNEKLYQCPYCDTKLSQKRTLNHHIKSHRAAKPFECSICHKAFRFNGDLKRHAAVHSEEKPYTCSVCNHSFKHLLTLNKHISIHTRIKPFECTLCNKKFRLKGFLRAHLKTHTQERPFSCSICSKKFRSKGNLDKHFMVHTAIKPFECLICNQKFRLKNTLVQHAKMHTGEKPYTCSVCKKNFRQKSHLNSHVKVHTNVEPPEC